MQLPPGLPGLGSSYPWILKHPKTAKTGLQQELARPLEVMYRHLAFDCRDCFHLSMGSFLKKQSKNESKNRSSHVTLLITFWKLWVGWIVSTPFREREIFLRSAFFFFARQNTIRNCKPLPLQFVVFRFLKVFFSYVKQDETIWWMGKHSKSQKWYYHSGQPIGFVQPTRNTTDMGASFVPWPCQCLIFDALAPLGGENTSTTST